MALPASPFTMLYRTWWCGWWLLVSPIVHAQPLPLPVPTLYLQGTAALRQPVALEAYLAIVGGQIVLPRTAVAGLPFRPLTQSGFDPDTEETQFWLRLRLTNTDPTDTLKAVFYGGDPVGLRLLRPDEVLTGQFQLWPFKFDCPDSDRFAVSLVLPPNTTRTCYLQTTNLISFGAFHPRLFSPAGYLRFHEQRMTEQRFSFGFSALVFGLGIFLGTIGLIMWVTNRDRVYGWWACYLWSNSLFIYVSADLDFNLNTLPFSMQVLLGPMEHVSELFYLLFFDAFLNLRHYDPAAHRVCQGLMVANGIMLGATLLLFGTSYLPLLSLNEEFFFLTVVIFTGVLIRVATRPILSKWMVLTGTILLILFACLAMYVDIKGHTDSSQFWQIPHVIFSLGVFVELIFLSLALSGRSLAIVVENQTIREAANQRIAEETTRRMEQETAFQLKLSEAEISALRSQMNPHFIFNCLNSIQYFTSHNQSEAASDYLAKFSRLIRQVLENSRTNRVTLANELETLELYLQLEVMRFDQKVHYSIQVDQQIDTRAIRIPPLLLQPFVENAIWHGLMHRPEGGQVTIEVGEPFDELLHITVTDNGVGRVKAAEYKSKSSVRHKSFGMKVTAERIALINQLFDTRTKMTIVDLVSTDGEAMGTKVIIEIPI